MVKSVARVYNWPPNVIGGLFIDDWDYRGLEYWFNDAIDQQPKKPKK